MIDFSTVKPLPGDKQHRLPPSYHYRSGHGSGCYMDPPGFPSYFLRSVWTRYGNHPHKGASHVLDVNGIAFEVPRYVGGREEWLRARWCPLPIEHPRIQAWIGNFARHFKVSTALDFCAGFYPRDQIAPILAKVSLEACGGDWWTVADQRPETPEECNRINTWRYANPEHWRHREPWCQCCAPSGT